MGVTRIRRGVHVLTSTAADGVLVRLAAERAVRTLGWVLAWSPADADVLVVCGTPEGAEADAVERVWQQLPGPRARVRLDDPQDVSDALVAAAAALEDRAAQEGLAHDADMVAQMSTQGGEDMDHAGMDHEDMDHGDMDHSGMNHDQMDHSHMDHGGMSTGGPAGIPLAEGASKDRDDLEMDAWHVVLGQGLPGWPAGLVLRVELHGDVVTDLLVLAEPTPHGRRDTPVQAALLLDAAASVLDLAGWSLAASASRRARDDVMEGRDPAEVAPRVERLARRMRRSVLLRWSLEGPRRRTTGDAPSAGHLVRSRAIGLLEAAGSMLTAPERGAPAQRPYDLDDLPALAVGQELATLRLLVAGLALDARVAADV
ncbi:MAG: hypothetical protein KQH57_11315 [Actinomycetales bacterium]|nr:hypothetical protein [Actinomycetales bacterium]